MSIFPFLSNITLARIVKLENVIVVVYTRRGEVIRIISARKANDREQFRYNNR